MNLEEECGHQALVQTIDGKGGMGKLHCLKGITLLLHSFIDREDEEEDMILL
jgi:hypothetical protein